MIMQHLIQKEDVSKSVDTMERRNDLIEVSCRMQNGILFVTVFTMVITMIISQVETEEDLGNEIMESSSKEVLESLKSSSNGHHNHHLNGTGEQQN